MKNYRYFNFRSFTAQAVQDDGLFDELFGFFYREINRERMQDAACNPGRPFVRVGFGCKDPVVNREVFERTLYGLKPLMEEGLVVIGRSIQRKKKTSFGFIELDDCDRPIEEMIADVRKDYDTPSDSSLYTELDNVGVNWSVQATTKGWAWANELMDSIPKEIFDAEDDDYFGKGV